MWATDLSKAIKVLGKAKLQCEISIPSIRQIIHSLASYIQYLRDVAFKLAEILICTEIRCHFLQIRSPFPKKSYLQFAGI